MAGGADKGWYEDGMADEALDDKGWYPEPPDEYEEEGLLE